MIVQGLPRWCRVRNLPANAGDARDAGLIHGFERSPGIGNGNPLQYSCLENSMERGAWQTIVHGVAKSQSTTDWLSMPTCSNCPVQSGDYSKVLNIPQYCRWCLRKQSTLHSLWSSFPLSNTLHPCKVSFCRTWASLQDKWVPVGSKPCMVNVQHILWDRFNLCHRGIFRAEDNT